MVVGDLATAVDVVVLGAGPGGYVAAIRLAQLGKAVALIDPGPPGGVCLNRGCIPSKALLAAAEHVWQAKHLSPMGIHAEKVTVDLSRMQAWKEEIVARLTGGVRQLLERNGVEWVVGKGWFLNENEVRVEGEYGAKRYRFEQAVIAVGGRPASLPGLPFDGERVLTPAGVFALNELPAGVSVIGADGMAVEAATFFARLGVPVRLLVPAGESLLAGFEPSVGRQVAAQLRRLGATVETGVADPVAATAEAAKVVVSVGQIANTDGLHLEEVGVSPGANGFLAVNDRLQTGNPAIYAVGDVTEGHPSLASVAMKQGKVAAEVIAGRAAQYAPQAVPRVVWTDPEVASVGLTAAEAEAEGYAIVRGRFPLRASGRALTLGREQGFVLTVAEAGTEVLLGVTVVGARAAELIGKAALALEMGATLTDVAETLEPHPGLGEALLESAEAALGAAVHIVGGGGAGA
ncbi:MAG: dihydrolipoyl dehydrogenase [Caldilineae bacterium]|nr:MAG: dihydrolipoyl dehydrogenase [Caldilineae bacterium]